MNDAMMKFKFSLTIRTHAQHKPLNNLCTDLEAFQIFNISLVDGDVDVVVVTVNIIHTNKTFFGLHNFD